jgi:hypothetical protein
MSQRIPGSPRQLAGDLVKVAGAQNQAEAELVQALLLDAGVPSVLRRAGGADVPDFLAAGARDVLVPASAAELAREALLDSDGEPAMPQSRVANSPVRLLAGLAVACLVVALIVWLGVELVSS